MGGVPSTVGYGAKKDGTLSVKNGDSGHLEQCRDGEPTSSAKFPARQPVPWSGASTAPETSWGTTGRAAPTAKPPFSALPAAALGHPFAQTEFGRRVRCRLTGCRTHRPWSGWRDHRTAVACPSGGLDEYRCVGSRGGTPNLPGGRQRWNRPESGQRHQLRRHRGGLVQCAYSAASNTRMRRRRPTAGRAGWSTT